MCVTYFKFFWARQICNRQIKKRQTIDRTILFTPFPYTFKQRFYKTKTSFFSRSSNELYLYRHYKLCLLHFPKMDTLLDQEVCPTFPSHDLVYGNTTETLLQHSKSHTPRSFSKIKRGKQIITTHY